MKVTTKPVTIECFKYDGDLMNSNGEYYSCVILSSLALGFFIAYVWIPLVQWIRAFM